MLNDTQIIKILLQNPSVVAFSELLESTYSYDHNKLSQAIGRDLSDSIGVWLSKKDTLCYIALLEREMNPKFNSSAFKVFIENAGAESYSLPIRKAIDEACLKTVKLEGENLQLSQELMIDFACWLSPEFKLYFLKSTLSKVAN
ncbi:MULTISPECIES: KilA-N domain-containing protein [Pseudoalteromonas]|uniref:KilA-N domain-containing protein n=1 Tax=Pseudoalteromonas TaxID=53246 RepID=UPI00044B12A0|nr:MULTISPECIES: KilA-N domain-containing protein [Pseudoalteromonas]EWH04483.1 hypothetical protein AT00_20025 [Pseudoalteromonas lipolytica SCSIO 04301]MCG9711137.1 KilA-N domain-containing protein [Pseudoalteromonas sp. Isolate3]TMO35765.1 hypothetical protein CWC26_17670 [Pseudoalteromonas sp. S4488]